MKNEIKIESFVTTAKLKTELNDVEKFVMELAKNQKMPKKLCDMFLIDCDILLNDIDTIKEYLKG